MAKGKKAAHNKATLDLERLETLVADPANFSRDASNVDAIGFQVVRNYNQVRHRGRVSAAINNLRRDHRYSTPSPTPSTALTSPPILPSGTVALPPLSSSMGILRELPSSNDAKWSEENDDLLSGSSFLPATMAAASRCSETDSSAETHAATQKTWSREEDRVLLEHIKETNHELVTLFPTKTAKNIVERIDFLTEFLTNLERNGTSVA